MSEEDAVRLTLSGDPIGFQALHDQHRPVVYRHCLKLLRDPDDAEDITQEVFLLVYQKISSFRSSECKFSTWLYRVTRNKLISHMRAKKARPEWGGGDAPDTAVAPTQHTLLEFNEALGTLPEMERWCVEVRMAGHSMKELGGVHYLSSAYQKLREVLA